MLQLTGITKNIDSCAGLINQRATQAFNQVRESDRRWLDREDLVQEGLIAALEAEATFREGAGQKFSSHLYTRLSWDMEHQRKAANRVKRRAAGLVELDAPIVSSGNDTLTHGDLVQDQAALQAIHTAGEAHGTVIAFQRLVGAVQRSAVPLGERYAAVGHLVKVLLLGHRTTRPLPDTAKHLLASAAVKAGISYAELAGCINNEITRKKLLRWAAGAVIMDLGAENKLRCLECVVCAGEFSLADVRDGRYYIEPGMCRACYREMEASKGSCFGKIHTSKQEGYQNGNVACRLHCADREVCRHIAKERKAMSDNTKLTDDLAEGLENLDKQEKAAAVKPAKAKAEKAAKTEPKAKAKKSEPKAEKVAKTVKAEKSEPKAKAEKPAKAAKTEPKAKKSEAEDAEDPAPKEVGGEWPWRKGSALRYCFQAAFAGITAKAFAKLFDKGGDLHGVANHDWMLQQLRSESSGKATKTHTWRFSEEGGRYQIFNVKYLLKKAKSDESKVAASAKPEKKSAKTEAKVIDKKKKKAA